MHRRNNGRFFCSKMSKCKDLESQSIFTPDMVDDIDKTITVWCKLCGPIILQVDTGTGMVPVAEFLMAK